MESVDSGSNIPVIPSQNGYLCITKNYIFAPADSIQPNTLSVWDQDCLLAPAKRPVPCDRLIMLPALCASVSLCPLVTAPSVPLQIPWCRDGLNHVQAKTLP